MNLKLKTLLLICLVVFCGSQINDIHAAAEPFGQITKLKGEPRVIRRLKPLDVKEGDPLFIGDRVRTKVTDQIEIRTTFDDVITVAPRTSMVLENKSKDGKKKEIFLELLGGTIKNKVNHLKKEESFLIRTPVSVVGVRGTTFIVEDNGTVVVIEGEVAVTEVSTGSDQTTNKENTDIKKGKEVKVKSNQKVTFSKGGKVSSPSRVSRVELLKKDHSFKIRVRKDVERDKRPETTQKKDASTQKSEDKNKKEEEKSDDSEVKNNKDEKSEDQTSPVEEKEEAVEKVEDSGDSKDVDPTESTEVGQESIEVTTTDIDEPISIEDSLTEEILEESDLLEVEVNTTEEREEVVLDIEEVTETITEEQTEEATEETIDEVQKETEIFILKFQFQHRDN